MPEESIPVILASISEGTQKQYNTALKSWWKFCQLNHLDPYDSNIPEIVRFLSQEFNRGLKHGTVNSFRSALSLILGPQVSENYNVRRFLKGTYNMKPNIPKYDSTWDPQIVLTHFSNQSRNENLELKELSKKLVTLLAVITAHRMQTFSLIEIDNIEMQTKGIIIKIPEKIKTSGLNKIQPTLVVPYFLDNCKVCAASTLVEYINRTREIRGSIQRLFISLKKPYKAVSSQTLSHWVCDTLAAAGLDTNIYTAHSTRHAAASAAKRIGISLDQIRKTAGWTENSSVFAKFYNRPIVEDKNNFANAIYGNST